MSDRVINDLFIDNQPAKLYAPNIIAGLEDTDEITQLQNDIAAETTRAEGEEARIEALFTAPTQEAVDNWLDEHPEATTTVQDGAITLAKLHPDVRADVEDISSIKENLSNVKSESNALEDGLWDTTYNQHLTWESGSISTSTGQDAVNSNYVRTNGYIKVLDSAVLTNNSGEQINIFYYNADKSFIRFDNLSNEHSWTIPPTDAAFARFRLLSSANTSGVTVTNAITLHKQIEHNSEQNASLQSGLVASTSAEWEVGNISTSTGAEADNSNYYRTSYISTNADILIKNNTNDNVFVFKYNNSKTFIEFVTLSSGAQLSLGSDDCAYFRLRILSTKDTSDVVIRLYKLFTTAEINAIAASHATKPSANQKLAVIGDSLSDTDYHTSHKWQYFLSDYDGYDVTTLAVSGSSYYNGSNKGGTTNHQFYNQASLVPNDTDLVLVFGSLNDIGVLYREECSIGTVSDSGTSTIGGCFNTMLSNLYAINAGMKIGVVIPNPWNGYNPGMATSNPYYQTVMDYVEFLETICKYNSIPCLNLFYESGMRPWDADFRNLYYWEADGTHPNEAGHLNYIYPKMREFLRKLNCESI